MDSLKTEPEASPAPPTPTSAPTPTTASTPDPVKKEIKEEPLTPQPLPPPSSADPWREAYAAKKAAALKNLESRCVQSISSLSGFCGKIDGVKDLTKKTQVTKIMDNLKAAGAKGGASAAAAPVAPTTNPVTPSAASANNTSPAAMAPSSFATGPTQRPLPPRARPSVSTVQGETKQVAPVPTGQAKSRRQQERDMKDTRVTKLIKKVTVDKDRDSADWAQEYEARKKAALDHMESGADAQIGSLSAFHTGLYGDLKEDNNGSQKPPERQTNGSVNSLAHEGNLVSNRDRRGGWENRGSQSTSRYSSSSVSTSAYTAPPAPPAANRTPPQPSRRMETSPSFSSSLRPAPPPRPAPSATWQESVPPAAPKVTGRKPPPSPLDLVNMERKDPEVYQKVQEEQQHRQFYEDSQRTSGPSSSSSGQGQSASSGKKPSMAALFRQVKCDSKRSQTDWQAEYAARKRARIDDEKKVHEKQVLTGQFGGSGQRPRFTPSVPSLPRPGQPASGPGSQRPPNHTFPHSNPSTQTNSHRQFTAPPRPPLPSHSAQSTSGFIRPSPPAHPRPPPSAPSHNRPQPPPLHNRPPAPSHNRPPPTSHNRPPPPSHSRPPPPSHNRPPPPHSHNRPPPPTTHSRPSSVPHHSNSNFNNRPPAPPHALNQNRQSNFSGGYGGNKPGHGQASHNSVRGASHGGGGAGYQSGYGSNSSRGGGYNNSRFPRGAGRGGYNRGGGYGGNNY